VSAGLVSLKLRFENVEKRYGSLLALRRLNLQIDAGQAVVLVGRNGSGKTTLLRVAAGLIRPSGGKVILGDGAGGAEGRRARIGFVAHQTMLYDELTAEENLVLFARLHGVMEIASRVDALLGESGLTERRASLVRTFSRGMRQRLTIARALLHRPALLLLDEPGTGLDVPGMTWLAETLRGLRDAGCTLVMSLHGQSELTALASRAIRLEAGAVGADSAVSGAIAPVLQVAGA
jgi:heme exporter protein A